MGGCVWVKTRCGMCGQGPGLCDALCVITGPRTGPMAISYEPKLTRVRRYDRMAYALALELVCNTHHRGHVHIPLW